MASLDNSLPVGDFLLGTYCGLMLCGLIMHQAYRYFRQSVNDSLLINSVVYPVLGFEVLHTVLCMNMGYSYLATHHGNPDELGNGVWSVDMIPLSAASVIMGVQLFFFRRVSMSSLTGKHRWVDHVSVFLLVLELGLLAAATAETFFLETFFKYKHVAWLISAGFGIAAVADIILTPALIITRSSGTTAVANLLIPTALIITVRSSLILYAVKSGLFTSTSNVLTFFLALIYTDNLIYIGFDIVASKRELNSRHSLSDSLRSSGVSAVYGANGSSRPDNSVPVHVETVPDLVEFSLCKSDHHLDRSAKGGSGSFVTAVTV